MELQHRNDEEKDAIRFTNEHAKQDSGALALADRRAGQDHAGGGAACAIGWLIVDKGLELEDAVLKDVSGVSG